MNDQVTLVVMVLLDQPGPHVVQKMVTVRLSGHELKTLNSTELSQRYLVPAAMALRGGVEPAVNT